MRRLRFLSAAPALLLVLVVGIFCSKETSVKVGVITILTGDGANYGKAAKRGIELALEEVNGAGGVDGKRVQLIYEDSRGEAKTALSAFQKLVSVDKVPIVIGPFLSSEVLPLAPIAEKERVVILSGSATSDEIKEAGEYTFRVCSSNDVQGKSVADFATFSLELRTAYLLYQNNEYGVSLKEVFGQEFKRNGGEILGEDAFPPGVVDLRKQLLKIKNRNPDVVFAPAHYREAGLLLKQAKELGLKSVIMGGDGSFDPELIRIAGNAAEGTYWATMGWGGGDTRTLTEGFRTEFGQKYGEEPGVYSGLYYDAMKVTALALERADGYNGTAIKDALLSIKDYEGPTGRTAFDSRGEVEKPFSIYQIRDGKFNLVK